MKLSFCKLITVFAFVLLLGNSALAQTEGETGIALYEKGEYEKAVESLQKAVKENKKDRQAWLYLGASLFKLKKENKAAGAFRKAEGISSPETKEKEDTFKIISKPRPSYTDAARMNQVQGKVTVAIEFGADGAINFVVPVHGLPQGLTENTVEAARQIKFEPATRDGKPVSVIKIIKYNFLIY